MKKIILMISMLILISGFASAVCYDLEAYDDVIYVDAVNGSDSTGDGSESNPYQTYNMAADNDGSNTAIYLQPGNYTRVASNSPNALDGDIIGASGGDVIMHMAVSNSWQRALSVTDDNHNFYNIIFEHDSASGSNTYYFGDASGHSLNFYNCVFKDKYSLYNGWYFRNINTVNLYNSFENVQLKSPDGNKYATNSIIYESSSFSSITTSLLHQDVTFDSEWHLTSGNWENQGTGQNPDGSQAHIGVYGGACAWGYMEDSVCGDGNVSLDEECDDGNTADGDGCNASCNVEDGYFCEGEPSNCSLIVCGDGDISTGEECDDGNTADGDGCNSSCMMEANYDCSGEPSNCWISPDCSAYPENYNGSGTSEDPYEVHDCYELQCMRASNSYYELMEDIDCSETKQWYNGSGFEPVSDFDGGLNGNYHKISDLYINRPSSDGVALFGSVPDRKGISLANIGLKDVNITGGASTAGMIGSFGGEFSYSKIINNIYVTGTIKGDANTGGLVGAAGIPKGSAQSISIQDIRVEADIEGGYRCGGLIGHIFSGNAYEGSISVTKTYATGTVNGGSDVGGLIGRFHYAYGSKTISSNYAANEVYGTSDVGGLLGERDRTIYGGGSMSTSNNWWYDHPGDNASVCVGEGGAVITCSEETTLSDFYDKSHDVYSGWDFENVWVDVLGDFPMFVWEDVPVYNVTEPASWNGFDLHDEYDNLIVNQTTQRRLKIKEGSDVKVEFEINASINLSDVFVDSDSTSTVVANLGDVEGVTGNHTLYVPVVEGVGVYVCPDAETLSEITTSCSGYVFFDYAAECDGNTAKDVEEDNVRCEIVSGNYKLSGLTGTGAKDYDPASNEETVPEFSAVGMILAVIIAIAGIVFVVKKKRR